MKRTIDIFTLGLFVMLVAAAGCSKPKAPPSDIPALQGAWKGQEVRRDATGPSSLVISGSTLEFHGSDTNEWYKATFTLHEDQEPRQLIAVITECSIPDAVGKTVNAVYKIDNGVLTLAGNAPGNPAMPREFGGPGVRMIVFKMDKP